MSTRYFSLQGKVRFGRRQPNGAIGPVRWAFNAPSFELAIKTTNEEVNESYTGQRLLEARIETGKSVTYSMSLSSFDVDTLARALYGSKATRIAGTVSAENFPVGLAVGDQVKLARERVSSVVVTDSAGTPATLVAGTDYVVDNAFAGILEIRNLGSYVQPLKAAYSFAETRSLALFAAAPEETFILFDGVNTVDNSPVYLELYRGRTNPAASLPMINSEGFGSLELNGSALYDAAKASDALLGGFGRMVFTGAT